MRGAADNNQFFDIRLRIPCVPLPSLAVMLPRKWKDFKYSVSSLLLRSGTGLAQVTIFRICRSGVLIKSFSICYRYYWSFLACWAPSQTGGQCHVHERFLGFQSDCNMIPDCNSLLENAVDCDDKEIIYKLRTTQINYIVKVIHSEKFENCSVNESSVMRLR